MKRLLVIVLMMGSLQACQRQGSSEAWLGPMTVVDVPAAPGSRFPNLAGGADLPVVLSWLQPDPDGGYSLRCSEWSSRGLGSTRAWKPPRKVASGTDWFINWADFPSVVPASSGVWAAHWLQQKPGDVFAYDVRLAVSSDGGATLVHTHFAARRRHVDRTRLRFVAGRRRRSDPRNLARRSLHTR